jgi:hypothetical protein
VHKKGRNISHPASLFSNGLPVSLFEDYNYASLDLADSATLSHRKGKGGSLRSYGLRNIKNPTTNAAAMTMMITQTQMEALASFFSSISITSLWSHSFYATQHN